MPMFDDPNRELNRLQRQLLEEEELDELMEEYGEEDYESLFQEDYEEETREPFYRNYSNGYGADIRNFANGYRGEALMDEEEDSVYYKEDYLRDKRKRRRPLKALLVLGILGLLAAAAGRVVGLW